MNIRSKNHDSFLLRKFKYFFPQILFTANLIFDMQGVVNVVMGNAPEIGDALLSSPKVDFGYYILLFDVAIYLLAVTCKYFLF